MDLNEPINRLFKIRNCGSGLSLIHRTKLSWVCGYFIEFTGNMRYFMMETLNSTWGCDSFCLWVLTSTLNRSWIKTESVSYRRVCGCGSDYYIETSNVLLRSPETVRQSPSVRPPASVPGIHNITCDIMTFAWSPWRPDTQTSQRTLK